MNFEDLKQFRETVANPRLMQLFENTPLQEGSCYINGLEISFLDGRSCGVDSEINASGLIYRNGHVEKYQYSEVDVSFADFMAEHEEAIFLSDGILQVEDEVGELSLRTKMRNIGVCGKLFFQLVNAEIKNLVFQSVEFEKMKFLMLQANAPEVSGTHPALSERLESASFRANQNSSFTPIKDSFEGR